MDTDAHAFAAFGIPHGPDGLLAVYGTHDECARVEAQLLGDDATAREATLRHHGFRSLEIARECAMDLAAFHRKPIRGAARPARVAAARGWCAPG